MLGWGLRQHTMPEIEDKRPSRQRGTDPPDLISQGRSAAQQHDRIEVPLDTDDRLKVIPGKCHGDSRVEPNRIDPGLTYVSLVEEAGSARKADDRHRRKRLFEGSYDASGRLDDPA